MAKKKKRRFLGVGIGIGVIAAIGLLAFAFVGLQALAVSDSGDEVGIDGNVGVREGEMAVVASAVTNSINYQGRLVDSAGEPLSGTWEMVFGLYNVSTGGTALATDTHDVNVTDGLFNTGIDFGTDYFDGRELWLGVTAKPDSEMTPRQELRPVPYALSLVPGADIIGSAPVALHAESTHPSGRGIRGYATATSGTNYGVVGASNSPDGYGGYFYNTNTTAGTGVYGKATGSYGKGVYGKATDSGGGINYGGYFTAAGKWGQGVYGKASGEYGHALHGTATGSKGYGVWGEASGSEGKGVLGKATDTGDGYKYGGYFQAAGKNGRAVYGHAMGSNAYAGYFDGDVYASDRVGIGTTTPDTKVEIHGDGSSWTEGFLSIKNEGKDAGIRLYDSDSDVKHHIFNDNAFFDSLRIVPAGTYTAGGITITQGGNVGIGTGTLVPTSRLSVKGNIEIRSRTTGNLVAELGEGLDYAEGFDVSGESEIEPGSVLIIDADNPGQLALSDTPYDTKVAGIVAGGEGVGSGVRLGAGQFDYDVALAGRVYCNVDATEAGVEPGDLLTPSTTPGYAMKATDYEHTQGAILGKAMEKLEEGEKGQILVLVTLQ